MSPDKQLIDAAKHGDAATVRNAILSGATPNCLDTSGWAPLMWAAQEGHAEVVEQLLTACADPNFAEQMASRRSDRPLANSISKWRKSSFSPVQM